MQLDALTLSASGATQVAIDPLFEFTIPRGFTVLGVSVSGQAYGGSPTNMNVDIVDDGTDVIAAVTAATAGTPGTWKSKALGGTNDPVHIAADSVVGVTINFSGGTSPTVTGFTCVLYGQWAVA